MINFQICVEFSEGVLKLVQDIVCDYLVNGLIQKELDDVKCELVGSFLLFIVSNVDIVGQFGVIGFYGLLLDYLESFFKQVEGFSVEQVRIVMVKYLDVDVFVIVSVGLSVLQKFLLLFIVKLVQ